MVDEDVVAAKLRHVNEYTGDLREMRRGLSVEQYRSDVMVQRAVERTFVNLIQACINLAQHVRSTEGLSPGGTAKEEIEALGSAGVLSSETQERLEEAVGFRNVLAHQYASIDHEAVYEALQNDLHWFDSFQQEVAEWFTREHA